MLVGKRRVTPPSHHHTPVDSPRNAFERAHKVTAAAVPVLEYQDTEFFSLSLTTDVNSISQFGYDIV